MAILNVKVVPAASRERIAGRLGEALKVCIVAAPERGKANNALIKLIAATIGVPAKQIRLLSGHAKPRKLLQIDGILQEDLDRRIAGIL